jgi:hypothetical protein
MGGLCSKKENEDYELDATNHGDGWGIPPPTKKLNCTFFLTTPHVLPCSPLEDRAASIWFEQVVLNTLSQEWCINLFMLGLIRSKLILLARFDAVNSNSSI